MSCTVNSGIDGIGIVEEVGACAFAGLIVVRVRQEIAIARIRTETKPFVKQPIITHAFGSR